MPITDAVTCWQDSNDGEKASWQYQMAKIRLFNTVLAITGLFLTSKYGL